MASQTRRPLPAASFTAALPAVEAVAETILPVRTRRTRRAEGSAGIPGAPARSSWSLIARGASVETGSGRALGADRLALDLLGQLAAVMDEEATRTGELVGLARKHPDRELFVREVRARKLERLGKVGFVDVDSCRRLVRAPCLQLLEAVLVLVTIGLAGSVVVGRHGPLLLKVRARHTTHAG